MQAPIRREPAGLRRVRHKARITPTMNCEQRGHLCHHLRAYLPVMRGPWAAGLPGQGLRANHCGVCEPHARQVPQQLPGRSLTLPARTAPILRRSLCATWPRTERRSSPGQTELKWGPRSRLAWANQPYISRAPTPSFTYNRGSAAAGRTLKSELGGDGRDLAGQGG
jgi:hypothetical protein